MERVYYIDGESFLRMMVEKGLKTQGLDCYTAENTLDGLYQVTDVAPDLVVYDLETDFQEHKSMMAELSTSSQIPVGAVGFEDKIQREHREFCEAHKIPLLFKPLSAQTLLEDFQALRDAFIEMRKEGAAQ